MDNLKEKKGCYAEQKQILIINRIHKQQLWTEQLKQFMKIVEMQQNCSKSANEMHLFHFPDRFTKKGWNCLFGKSHLLYLNVFSRLIITGFGYCLVPALWPLTAHPNSTDTTVVPQSNICNCEYFPNSFREILFPTLSLSKILTLISKKGLCPILPYLNV